MRRYLICFAYDGSYFQGYQKQTKFFTVQSCLEEQLERILKAKIKTVAAARTDTGVHALRQMAHMDADLPMSEVQLARALNKCLKEKIRIHSITEVSSDFHARYKVKSRVYIYSLYLGKNCPFYLWKYLGQVDKKPRLDLIKRGLKMLKGKKDFAAFCASGSSVKSTVRNLMKVHVKSSQVEIWPGVKSKSKEDLIWQFYFEADGFLYHMIRNIMGSLLDLGFSRISLEQFQGIIESKDRRKAGKTFDACGLCLWDIKY